MANVAHGIPADLLRFVAHPQGGYVAFIGRISPEKRPDRAIRIARRFGIPLKIAAKVDKVDREIGDARGVARGGDRRGRFGFEFGMLSVQEQPRIGLMVTAISKDVWLNAPLASEAEIPRVWRVVAIAPLTKEDMITKLVEAAGAKLGEIASVPPAPPSPTPSRTPKKEP